MRLLTIAYRHNLKHGDIIAMNHHKNSDGTCVRWRVSGQVKRWKRDHDKFRVPVKHGLRDNGYIDNSNFNLFHVHGSCPACN